jgi:hypothetical protein
MTETGKRQCLFAKAAARTFLAQAPSGQDFYRYVAIEALIASPIHNTHASGANLLHNAVPAESCILHGRICSWAGELKHGFVMVVGHCICLIAELLSSATATPDAKASGILGVAPEQVK